MYWLISAFILVIMIGVLAVVDTLLLPQPMLPTNAVNSSFLIAVLIVVTFLLGIVQQHKTLSVFNSSTSTLYASAQRSNHAFIRTLFVRITYQSSTVLLVLILLVGSLLQTLMHHQRSEATKVVDPMRVQAWVTIEGISDSVYDVAHNSGYRQVATISHIVPLTDELTPQDLNDMTTNAIDAGDKDSFDIDNTTFITENNEQTAQSVSQRVLLSLYPKESNDDVSIDVLTALQPGDQLLMTLALAPLKKSEQVINNPTGFDSYRWLRARHIDGAASILAVSSVVNNVNSLAPQANENTLWQRLRLKIDSWRWQLRQHFYQNWATKTLDEQQAQAVTLSLLTGDRSLINRDTKDLYQLAGISHLLAISGTHVLFLAIILAALVTKLITRTHPALYRILPSWQVRWWVMIGSAFIYALFTGFDVPAARTAWMLLAIGLVRFTLLPISAMQVLMALAVLMAWFDPYVLWQAGFWLSFIAVALLLKYDSSLENQQQTALDLEEPGSYVSRAWLLFKRILRLQSWLFIALLPITLLLFGKASLWGLVINLFAIGLFGWIIVPLNLLAGLCYLLSPTLADSVWIVVSAIVNSLHNLISWVTSLPMLAGAWLYTPINVAMLLMAVLIILPWLLPRGLLSKGLSVIPLSVLVMTVYANQRAFTLTPTLYILSTGDRYLSAVILQYPLNTADLDDNDSSTSWLFLADHRLQDERTWQSRLSDEKLAALLEQQLRTLTISSLDGVIVQTGSATMTNTLLSEAQNSESNVMSAQASNLLPMAVARLSQALPINQYWQAGRHERWSDIQSSQQQMTDKRSISAQDCQQDKIWQSLDEQLTIQALTGWREIDDTSVWDCSIAITSQLPIAVVHYNAADPRQPLVPVIQTLTANEKLTTNNGASKLVIEAATHRRHWQLWSLLCDAQLSNVELNLETLSFDTVTWLSPSDSLVPADVLKRQKVSHMISYDNSPSEVALSLSVGSNLN